jgi:glucan phosphoethanolaminetransferase (alkaline phosphatase superfamily)
MNNDKEFNDMESRLDLSILEATHDNMEFMKQFQLQIVYYTLLVYFAIIFLTVGKNTMNYWIVISMIVFCILLLFLFIIFQVTLYKELKDTREQQSKIEKYYKHRNWKSRKENRAKINKMTRLYLWGYILLVLLSSAVAISALFSLL